MHRFFFLTVILILFLHHAQGQSIYSVQQDNSWEFRFSGSRKADQYNNMVLKQLGLAHLKVPENTSFTFFYSYGASVSFQQGNLLDVSLALTPGICTGDVEVRDFDLQKMLVPAFCSIRLSVIDPVKGEIFTSIKDNLALIDLLAGYTVASFPDTLWTQNSKIEVQFRGFRFDESSYKKLEKELYAIRDYDAATTLTDSIEKKIRQVRIRLHTPQEAFRIYVFCNKSLYLLSEAVKTKTEIVPGNDPGNLMTKYPVLRYQFEDLNKFFIDEGIDGPLSGNVYLNLAKGFGSAVGDALKQSQKVDYYCSPFYYRLYSNSTTAAQLATAGKLVRKFALSRGLHSVDFRLLSLRIVDEYLRQGEFLMAEGRFSEAVDLLTSANSFCSVNPSVFVPLKLHSALLNARSGLTSSYIRIVQKALDNNLTSLADKYLSEAMQYASRNNNMSAADSAGFAGLYSVLTGNNIQAGNNYLNRKNYQAALAEFDKAYIIATQFKLSRVIAQAEDGQIKAVDGIYNGMFEKAIMALNIRNPDLASALLNEARLFAEGYPLYRTDLVSIENLIYQIGLLSYEKTVADAEKIAIVSNYKNVVSILLKASEISHKYRITSSALYDSLVSTAGVPWINTLFAEGRLKHWAGEPDSALMMAREAMQLASALGIDDRQDFQEQFAALMQMTDESLCNRVKGELKSLISRAGESFSENKFEAAASSVMKARELIYTKAGCGINTVELNRLTERYQHPVQWNEMVKSATSLISSGDFLKGIESLQQAGAIFTYYRLDTMGLANTGLFDLAIVSDHIQLVRHATGHYITRGGYDQAMRLLDRLRQLGANEKDTYELQESLARVLAKRDVAESGVPDVKVMLKVYTGGDKWYKRFGEVYRYHIENE